MKTIKAREFVIPSNLPELLDRRARRPEGELRNILADGGKLHDIERETLQIALAFEVKGIMEATILPGEPMSLKRFAEMMWVMIFTYVSGTLKFTEEGELQLGELRDIAFIADLVEADEFEFRGGKRVPAKELMPVLQHITSEEQLKGIYDEMIGRNFFKRKELSSKDTMNLAQAIMEAADALTVSKVWSK